MKSQEVAHVYDKKIKHKYNHEYEQKRWFSDRTKKVGFEMTRETILHFLSRLTYTSLLEVGPGPGTWTKFFIEKNPHASYDLVDVSGEMLSLAKENLKHVHNITFYHSGFLEFTPKKQYDVLFSSRAIEYITDKKLLIEHIATILKKEGEGLIITKNPHKRSQKRLGKIHQFQFSPKEFTSTLTASGFTVLKIVPATLHFPIIRIPLLDKFLFSLFGNKKMNVISSFFAESYCIHFKKL